MGLALALPSAHPPAIYRPRQPRKTALYKLVEQYYEDVKAVWEDRFEKKFGRWRGFIDNVVWRYLDCSVEEADFVRLKCDSCELEKLLTFSCKGRGLCPSCDAKRAAAFAAFLRMTSSKMSAILGELIGASGLTVESLENFYMGSPKIRIFMYIGVANRLSHRS